MRPQGPISSSLQLGGIYTQNQHEMSHRVIISILLTSCCNKDSRHHSVGVRCLQSVRWRQVKKMSNPRPGFITVHRVPQFVNFLRYLPKLACPGIRLVISQLTNPTKNRQETLQTHLLISSTEPPSCHPSSIPSQPTFHVNSACLAFYETL